MSLPAISLSATTVAAAATAGTVVGAFSGIDPSARLVLIDTAGDRFALNGSNLVVGAVPIAAGSPPLKVVARQEDCFEVSATFEFHITVTGAIAPAPVFLDKIGITADKLQENSPSGTYIGAITGVRPGSTLSLVDDDAGRFSLAGGHLVAGSVRVSYAVEQRKDIIVRETNALAPAPGYRDNRLQIHIKRDGTIALPDITSVPINTTAPAITGTTKVGQSLTVSPGTWTNSPDTYAYQWRANGANIPHATAATYVPTAGDLGKSLSVLVTAVNGQGAWSAVSAPTAPIASAIPAPTNTVLPAISGTIQVGQVVSVSNGTWTGSPTSYTYQWLRDGVVIAGLINASRVLNSADLGTHISCTVTAINAGGSAAATSAASIAVAAAPVPVPVNTTAPVILGSAALGNTISVSDGIWSNSPTSYSYQWRRAGVNISGATSSTYTVIAADEGQALTCRVLATNTGGSAAALSSAVNVPYVLNALTLSSVAATAGQGYSATINGTTAGSTVTATSSDGTALTVSGNTISGTFAGAGSPTVTLTEHLASASNDGRASPVTVTVSVQAAPVNTVAPAISGTAAVGNTILVSNGTWTGSPSGYSYQWLRNGTNIAGATSSSYLVAVADEGASLTCRVLATNIGGSTPAVSGGVTIPYVLNNLTLSNGAATAGQAFSATISGATTGSTITATSSDGTALTVSGLTVSGTFAGAGSANITLTEHLAAASNDGRTSSATVTIAAAAVLSVDPAVTLTKATGAYSFVIHRSGNTTGTTVANYSVAASTLPGRTGALVGPDFGGTWPSGTVTFNPGDTAKTVTITPPTTSNVSPE